LQVLCSFFRQWQLVLSNGMHNTKTSDTQCQRISGFVEIEQLA